MDEIKDLRKSLKILREQEDSKETLKEAVFMDDGPLDVDPISTGPETRVEVSFIQTADMSLCRRVHMRSG